MRKIKFRGKLVADSKAFKGYKKDSFVYGGIYREGDKWYIVVHFNVFEVDPETIGQFTGLTDKNGKEIYEGDILSDGKGENGIVIWVESLGGFRVNVNQCLYSLNEGNPNRSLKLEYTEIIGNIHDNPELLT